ncbi:MULTISPECIES: CBS domain-containing protein [unclassified Sporolactobacillus]|uniref:CBS domain-containing protein n=1 Tax=unclassified Sporolactobacillus TaxID=2628533 RepID=UPI002368EBC2|nr:CBS domain-containing protein [Sporolactobacillus sp. CQH2019]MDD9146996.1 CBS domain-containing protein [Sporolactobacillus sp. CQH2019]
MLVEDLMIKDVISVHENDSIEALIRTLIVHKIGSVPVLNDQDKLAGFVTDGDILRAVSPMQQTIYDFYVMIVAVEAETPRDKVRDLLNEKVKDIMKKRNIQTVYVNKDVDAVLKILSHHHFKKLPVIDGERHVVGIISRSNLIRYIGELAISKK